MDRHPVAPTTMPPRIVSTASEGAANIEGAIPIAQKGAAGGVSDLDNEGKIPTARIRMATETRERLTALDAALAAIQLTPGPKGDPGERGLTGEQGLPGLKGDKGDQGLASIVPGPKGDPGVKGDTGSQGVKGDQGIQGVKGDTGAASTVPGPKGDPGLKGDQGIQGVKGDTGLQGPAGAPLSASAAIGYATGAGGVITQATSRVTGVTLNKPSGGITLFSKTTTANLIESFVVTNSFVAVGDTINLAVKGTAVFLAFVTDVNAGSFRISIFTPVATTAQAPVIYFAVVKGPLA